MELETLNKLYLEISQFTTAISKREMQYRAALKQLAEMCDFEIPADIRGLIALGNLTNPDE